MLHSKNLQDAAVSAAVMPPRSQPASGALVLQFRGGSRWPRTIRIRQDASVTTAEPAIAVARDQIIDRVADHPWDELGDPRPLPARKLARNAQHRFGFYMGLAARQEGKGIRVIRIDAKLLSERTSFDQLDWNEKQPRRSRLLTKRQPREHRTQTPSNRIGPCGELMPPGLFGSTTIDCFARMGKANTSGTAGDHLADAARPRKQSDQTRV